MDKAIEQQARGEGVNYYNEIDPHAAQWLRNLIEAGLIPVGDIDTRSIEDVTPNELRGYTQCHFFAGIGGWPLALRLAGWPGSRPVWTGSCPCQPFSTAGKGVGFADERHLWPAFFHLIEQCCPPVVFGEQVASKDGLAWLDLVSSDLEGAGYAVGAADLCAAGVGAPHIRQRLWWVAERLGHHHHQRLEGHAGHGDGAPGRTVTAGSIAEAGGAGGVAAALGRQPGRGPGWPDPTNGFWRDADWLFCRDGKWRPVEPGTFPLAHGVPARVGRLRGYGNAIVPQAAAEVIASFLDIEQQRLHHPPGERP